jgi:hypothetical protein
MSRSKALSTCSRLNLKLIWVTGHHLHVLYEEVSNLSAITVRKSTGGPKGLGAAWLALYHPFGMIEGGWCFPGDRAAQKKYLPIPSQGAQCAEVVV